VCFVQGCFHLCLYPPYLLAPLHAACLFITHSRLARNHCCIRWCMVMPQECVGGLLQVSFQCSGACHEISARPCFVSSLEVLCLLVVAKKLQLAFLFGNCCHFAYAHHFQGMQQIRWHARPPYPPIPLPVPLPPPLSPCLSHTYICQALPILTPLH